MWQMSQSNQYEISSSLLPETIKKCRILHDGGPLFFCHPGVLYLFASMTKPVIFNLLNKGRKMFGRILCKM